MIDDPTTVLYVLTTLAQSCAALAAFVGAVGVFRLQMLRDQRGRAEFEIRAQAQKLFTWDVFQQPILETIKMLEDKDHGENPGVLRTVAAAMEARDQWKDFVPRMKQTRTALILLELWTLFVIGISLIGFNYVPALTHARWFSSSLWVAAVGTVTVVTWCVVVWTQGVEK